LGRAGGGYTPRITLHRWGGGGIRFAYLGRYWRGGLGARLVTLPWHIMVHCTNASCRGEIEESYCFCPYCGTDNRAPESRRPVGGHVHEYPSNNCAYCVICGEGYDDRFAIGRKKRKKIGLSLIAASLALVVFAAWVWSLTNLPPAETKSTLARWCQETFLVPGARRREGWFHRGPRTWFPAEKGAALAFVSGLAGFGFGAYGFLLVFQKAMSRRQIERSTMRYTDEQRDLWN
jgi:hypothetical protein